MSKNNFIMKVNKITVYKSNGEIYYIDSSDDIHKVLVGLPKVSWKKESPKRNLQRLYFFMLKELCENTNIGYNKEELHAALKPIILTKLKENNENFENGVFKDTTAALTHDGWVTCIALLKTFANDIFGYTFK